MRYLAVALFGVFVALLFAGNASAVEKTDGFVCPVLKAQVGEHNPQAVQIGGGDFTIAGPDVSVPIGATNGDGTGTPPGPHASPGDTEYTAIWAGG